MTNEQLAQLIEQALDALRSCMDVEEDADGNGYQYLEITEARKVLEAFATRLTEAAASAATALARFGHHDADCLRQCGCGHLLAHHAFGVCVNCGGSCPNERLPVRDEVCTCGFNRAKQLFERYVPERA